MGKSALRFFASCDATSPNVARYLTVVGLCYPLGGVSRLLASDPAWVRTAAERHELIALRGTPLFPVWQFPHGRLLPHLAASIAALPLDRMEAEDASLWFTRPRRALHGTCPAQWLQRGGDPALVRALASARTSRGHGKAAAPAAARADVVPTGARADVVPTG
jgi:hypothetical protein